MILTDFIKPCIFPSLASEKEDDNGYRQIDIRYRSRYSQNIFFSSMVTNRLHVNYDFSITNDYSY